ncbi:MAG: hypothetical protein V3U43_01635 [Pseudomonadales bacterium]
MTGEPVTPVAAATILMLRDSDARIEVFMVERHHQIDFASGALVFPGGMVDRGDEDPALRDLADGAGGLDTPMLTLAAAAIREAFEECGILLAREEGATELVSAARLETLEPYRDRLHEGKVSLVAFLRDEKLHLACDRLTRFAHWITPERMPKRYDTHFYIALAPQDHIGIHDGHESVDSVWITPQAAMEAGDAGRRTVIFPTFRNLELLGQYANVADAISASRGRDIVCVTPWTEERDDGNYLCIPVEAGYPTSEEKLKRPD